MAKNETAGKAPSKTALLSQLENTTDQKEKRNIRAQLRKLGHTGGLGSKRGRPAAKPAKTAPAAGRRAGRRANPTPAAAD